MKMYIGDTTDYKHVAMIYENVSFLNSTVTVLSGEFVSRLMHILEHSLSVHNVKDYDSSAVITKIKTGSLFSSNHSVSWMDTETEPGAVASPDNEYDIQMTMSRVIISMISNKNEELLSLLDNTIGKMSHEVLNIMLRFNNTVLPTIQLNKCSNSVLAAVHHFNTYYNHLKDFITRSSTIIKTANKPDELMNLVFSFISMYYRPVLHVKYDDLVDMNSKCVTYEPNAMDSMVSVKSYGIEFSYHQFTMRKFTNSSGGILPASTKYRIALTNDCYNMMFNAYHRLIVNGYPFGGIDVKVYNNSASYNKNTDSVSVLREYESINTINHVIKGAYFNASFYSVENIDVYKLVSAGLPQCIKSIELVDCSLLEKQDWNACINVNNLHLIGQSYECYDIWKNFVVHTALLIHANPNNTYVNFDNMSNIPSLVWHKLEKSIGVANTGKSEHCTIRIEFDNSISIDTANKCISSLIELIDTIYTINHSNDISMRVMLLPNSSKSVDPTKNSYWLNINHMINELLDLKFEQYVVNKRKLLMGLTKYIDTVGFSGLL